MGKHSKPRRTPKSPLWAALLLPVGILAGAATAGADDPAVAPTPLAAPAPAERSAPAPAASDTDAAPSTTSTPAPERAPEPAPAPAPRPASVTTGAVPVHTYDAYRAAEKTMATTTPRCGIDWKLIAGIGKVESHHAETGDVDARGTLRSPIFGPRLDGSLAGNQVVNDTDGGLLDGDPAFDRAVGPMQFLPGTWKSFAADGNGDGIIDPQNLFDAALTTARYLCDGNLDLRNAGSQVTAVLRYNNSMTYVQDVLGFARSY